MKYKNLNQPKRSLRLAYFFEGRSGCFNLEKNNIFKILFYYSRLIITSLIDRYLYRHYDYLICGSDSLVSLIIAMKLSSFGKSVLLAPTTNELFAGRVKSIIDIRQSFYTEETDKLVSNYFGLNDFHHGFSSLVDCLATKINNYNDNDDFGFVEILDSDRFYVESKDCSLIGGFRQVLPGRMIVCGASDGWDIVRSILPLVKFGSGDYDTVISVENIVKTSRCIRIDSDGSYNGLNYSFGDSKNNTELLQYLGEEERVSDIISALYFTEGISRGCNVKNVFVSD